ncbi:sensor histidine kinase [Erysipelothrix sp. HDW6B]|uniref:sensor histidine kinase n=1 Tax=Erysipelothrix TaxID=1647 RepID=UPI00135C5FF2|nr:MULTISPECIES: GHKL domain-containing protein [Erysipelothrix]QIK85715.1 sensor histidine kinase [Erysipelothrix sp. HDW6B]
MYLTILGLFTIALYCYIYMSVADISQYGKFRKHAYVFLAISMVTQSIIFIFSHSYGLEMFETFWLILAVMWLTFYFTVDLPIYVVSFATVSHVFYLFTMRAFAVTVLSIVTQVPLYRINASDNFYLLVFLISTVMSITLLLFESKYYRSGKRMRQLINNHTQLNFVTIVKFSLASYLMFITYGTRFSAKESWNTLAYCVGSMMVVWMARLTLNHSVRISEMLEYEKQTAVLQQQLNTQVSHYKSYQKYTETFRKFRHDYKKVLSTVNMLLRNNETEKAVKLLDDMGVQMAKGVDAHVEYSNNVFIDAILQAYANYCAEAMIQFEAKVYWDPNVIIDDLDLARIFNNVLENAYEANLNLDHEQRFIKIRSNLRDYWLDIEVANSFSGTVKDNLETTKTEETQFHGIGTKIVEEVMQNQGGMVSWLPEEDVFKVRLHFPRKA